MMESEETIKGQINQIEIRSYSDWRIAITDDLQGDKVQIGNPLSWFHWIADSEHHSANGDFDGCPGHRFGLRTGHLRIPPTTMLA